MPFPLEMRGFHFDPIISINPLKNHRKLKDVEIEKPGGIKSTFQQIKNHQI